MDGPHLRRRSTAALMPLLLALLAGCQTVRESDGYAELPPPAGRDTREREIVRVENIANRGGGPAFVLVRAGAGPALTAMSRGTFMVEALTPEGTIAQREEVHVLVPDLFDPEGFGPETGVPAPKVCTDYCWPLIRRRGHRVVQHGGSVGFATVFVANMRVGEVRSTRGDTLTLRTLGEHTGRAIRKVPGRVHVSATVLRPEGMVTIDRWDPADVVPDQRITLVAACRADVRLVRHTHARHVGIGDAQLPAGLVTHHWYEDHGCRQ